MYRSNKGRSPSGKWPIVFREAHGIPSTKMKVACGQCVGCRLEKSRQWAVRCVHESKEYLQNSFITLTYNDENLIKQCGVTDEQYNNQIIDYSLNKKDFQLFMKRLRKRYAPQKIRYFHCGEYGEEKGRPHHHAILFNIKFKDQLYHCQQNGEKYYTSETLNKIWGMGHCIVGKATYKSAAYVARYLLKKINGKEKEEYYDGVQPEYTTMSRNKGIGHKHFEKYGKQIMDLDEVAINGMKMVPPKYYDILHERIDPEKLLKVKEKRKARAIENEKENTPERLKAKERIKRKRIKCLVRGLEKSET